MTGPDRLTPAYRHNYRRALLGDESAYNELARIAEEIKKEVGDTAGLAIITGIEQELEALFKGVLR